MEQEAQQYIDSMRGVYSRRSAYVDRGKIAFVTSQTETAVFSTRFLRPSHFRIDFESELAGQIVIWRAGEDVHSWRSVGRETTRYANLQAALRAFGGISLGLVGIVPPLLMRDEIVFDRVGLIAWQRVQEEGMPGGGARIRIDGVQAIDLVAIRAGLKNLAGADSTSLRSMGTDNYERVSLALDASTLMVRRFTTSSVAEKGTEVAIEYEAVDDVGVSAEDCLFSVPVSRK
jgi:hypothetical protein